jgi:hypothetical protein
LDLEDLLLGVIDSSSCNTFTFAARLVIVIVAATAEIEDSCQNKDFITSFEDSYQDAC